MTLDEILFELSSVDEDTSAAVVLVVSRRGGIPAEVRTMATASTSLDLLAGAGMLLDLVETRADDDTTSISGDVVANCHIAGIHLGMAVDALMSAAPRPETLS